MKENNKIPPKETEKEKTYTWRKDKGFVVNGYIKTDKDGNT